MDTIHLIKGLAIGFSLAAPVGPVGILCIRRTLTQSSLRGLIVGLAAASADMVYGIVAAFGITLISNFVSNHIYFIRIFGGILLLILGYRAFHSHPVTESRTNGINSIARTYLSAFILTLTNPFTLFAFAAVFAGLGLERTAGNCTSTGMLILGVFLGSLCWFTLLCTLAHFFKEKISTDGIVLVNKTAGILLILFGFIALISGLVGL